MLTIYRGASFLLTTTVKDEAGAAIDLTGATVRAEIRTRAAVSATLLLDLAPTISDGPGGVITINISPAATAALSPQVAKWDMVADMPGGDALVIVPTDDIQILPLATAPA